MARKSFIVIISLLFASVLSWGREKRILSFEDWITTQNATSWTNLLRNINPPGTVPGVVVASPSRQNPDYWYHWVRDAALVMDVVLTRYENEKVASEKAKLLKLLLDYLQFSRQNQLTPTVSGGPGEPKFNVDGSAYTDNWGRPQDDGPALRAMVLTRFAKLLLAQGQESLVREKLYGTFVRATTVIKQDLEYVSHHWRDTSVDLWEEIRGHHFFTRMVQRKALLEGALLAFQMGDGGAGQWYQDQARLLQGEINYHWDSARKSIVETIHQNGGAVHKSTGLDAATLLGVLHGATSDGFMSVVDEKVLATVIKIKELNAVLYPINQSGPGVAIGRYLEDTYDGYTTNGTGNPWVLLTNTFAEFYYKAAREYENRGVIEINRINERFFADLGFEGAAGQIIKRDGQGFRAVIQALRVRGDEFLKRTQFHADANGQLSEQMNRWSGFMQGARDLTWSYATLLTATAVR